MKKYLILILSLCQNFSWACSDPSQPQDFDPDRRSQVFRVLCKDHKLLDYLFHEIYDRRDKSDFLFKKNFYSFILVSKEWYKLAYQETKTIAVNLPFPLNLEKFPHLKELSSNGSKYTPIPPELTLLTHLKVLNVRNLWEIENTTNYLTTLTNLKVFKAKDCCAFTDENIKSFEKLTALQTLHLAKLSCEHFTDKGLSTIKHLTRLKDLKLKTLSSNAASGLEIIFQLTQLKRLCLQWISYNDFPNLTNITRLVLLKSLTLVWTWGLDFLQGIEIIGQLTLLQELKIYHNKVLKEHLSVLLFALTNLTSLDLRGCNVFDDNSLAEFLKTEPLPQLTYVHWRLRGASPPGGPFSGLVADRAGFIIGYKRA